jgi:hypothetical protein
VAVAVLGLFATASAAVADVNIDTVSKQDACIYPLRRTTHAVCVNLPDRLPIPPLF